MGNLFLESLEGVFLGGVDVDGDRLGPPGGGARRANLVDALFAQLQEAGAARTIATKDAADMFKIQASDILTPDIRVQLDNFKRTRAMGPAWR